MPPSSSSILRQSFRLARKGNNKEEAVRGLTEVIDKGFKDPRLFIRRGVLTGAKEDFERAETASAGSNRAVFYFSSLSAYRRGDFDETIATVKRSQAEGVKNLSLDALYALSMFSKDGTARLLQDAILEILHATPQVQSLTLLEVEKQIASKNSSDRGAKEKEDQLGGIPGFFFDKLDELAFIIYWVFASWWNFLVNIVNSKQRKFRSCIITASTLAGLGMEEKSIRLFKLALKENPGELEPLEFLTELYLRRGEWGDADKALTTLEESFGKDEACSSIYLRRWRADILTNKGEYAKASDIYEKISSEFPLDYIVPYRQGLCAVRTGDFITAERFFGIALSHINPSLLEDRIKVLS